LPTVAILARPTVPTRSAPKTASADLKKQGAELQERVHQCAWRPGWAVVVLLAGGDLRTLS
jgi:hypothetical protein